jgi:hypothetical protein
MGRLKQGERSLVVGILDEVGGRERWFTVSEIARASQRQTTNVRQQLNRSACLGHVQMHEDRYRIPVEGVDGTKLPGYVVTDAGLAEPVTPPPAVQVNGCKGPAASPILAVLQELTGSENRWVPYRELLATFRRSTQNTKRQLDRSIRLGHIEESEGRYRIAGGVGE